MLQAYVFAFVCICLRALLVYVPYIQVEGEQPLRSFLTQIIIREMMDGSALYGSLNSIPSCLGFPAQTLIVNVVVAQIVDIVSNIGLLAGCIWVMQGGKSVILFQITGSRK